MKVTSQTDDIMVAFRDSDGPSVNGPDEWDRALNLQVGG